MPTTDSSANATGLRQQHKRGQLISPRQRDAYPKQENDRILLEYVLALEQQCGHEVHRHVDGHCSYEHGVQPVDEVVANAGPAVPVRVTCIMVGSGAVRDVMQSVLSDGTHAQDPAMIAALPHTIALECQHVLAPEA